ncbi:MAG: hypothetical protein M3443_06410 [Actinomycetota bacterium]|nr:hypothetical protein [Actinomycetota bacterium]
MSEARKEDPNVVDAEVVVEPVSGLRPDYSEDGVPSFGYVRDKIDNRVTTADGSVELAGLGGTGPDVKSLDEQLAEREEAGRAKLAEIRRAMGRD